MWVGYSLLEFWVGGWLFIIGFGAFITILGLLVFHGISRIVEYFQRKKYEKSKPMDKSS